MPANQREDGEPDIFSTTRWDLIRLARDQDPSEYASHQAAAHALNDLCRLYRGPILGYLKRRTSTVEDAEYLAQEFCAGRIRSELLAHADIQHGRFRALLLATLKNFLRDLDDRHHAEKRGGDVRFVPLDDSMMMSHPGAARPEDISFDICWAKTVVERALAQLKGHFSMRGDSTSYDLLLPFLGQKADRIRLTRARAASRLESQRHARADQPLSRPLRCMRPAGAGRHRAPPRRDRTGNALPARRPRAHALSCASLRR